MSEKIVTSSIAAPESIWQMAKELGDGNASSGIREAVKKAHAEWERENAEAQAKYWAERAARVQKGGESQ